MKEGMIEELVMVGKLPMAFTGLVFEKNHVSNQNYISQDIHKPYMQRNICNADASCLITKIYDVF